MRKIRIWKTGERLEIVPKPSYNPLIPPKSLPIIVDLILHAKLIFAGLKKMGNGIEPGELVPRAGLEPATARSQRVHFYALQPGALPN